MTVLDRVPSAPRRVRRWLPALAAVATLAVAGAAQASDVRWSIGLNLPLPPLPGVVVRSGPVYAPPVRYAPPVSYAPPVVYAPPPAYVERYEPYPAYGPSYGPSYGPEVVTYERYPRHPGYRHDRYRDAAPVYVQPRVIVRPAPPRRHWHGGWS